MLIKDQNNVYLSLHVADNTSETQALKVFFGDFLKATKVLRFNSVQFHLHHKALNIVMTLQPQQSHSPHLEKETSSITRLREGQPSTVTGWGYRIDQHRSSPPTTTFNKKETFKPDLKSRGCLSLESSSTKK